MVRNLTKEAPFGEVVSPAQLHRELTLSLSVQQQLNAQLLTTMSWAFRLGAFLLVVQILATVAARVLTS